MPDLISSAPPESGVDWLDDRRRQAADAAAAQEWPTTDEEIWRYSRIRALDKGLLEVAPTPSPDAAGASVAERLGELAAHVVMVDGVTLSVTVNDPAVTVLRDGDLVPEVGPGTAMGDAVDVFAALNDAHAPDPVAVWVDPSAVVDAPVLVEHHVTAAGATVLPRLVVVTGQSSEVTVVERHTSAPGTVALSLPVTELRAGANSSLRHVTVQDLDHATWQIGSQISVSERDARLATHNVALGGDYARLRIDTRIVEPNARADIRAVYFGEGDQMLDFRTVQDHLAPHTASDLLFKGAVGGSSHSVYTGNIRIAKDAADVDAFQTNRNIKLSPDAWAESVPNLEIENNDVRCSHASAVGPIDADQRFYLEARGVPPKVAERLVVTGFFDEVLARLPVPALAEILSEQVADRLEALENAEGDR